jgi:hypothetical protein
MADFKGTILTTAGRNLLAKALTGAKLEFTKVQLGDGVWDGVNPESLTALVSPKLDLPINDLKITGDGTVRLRVLLTNTGLTEGFFTRELGIFAKDPDTGEEVLYSVAYAENPDFIPSNGVTKVENVFDVYTVIANAQNVTAVISDTVILATKQDIEQGIEEHNQSPEAHPDIREAIKEGFLISPDTFPGLLSHGWGGQPPNQGVLLLSKKMSFSILSAEVVNNGYDRWKVCFPVENPTPENLNITLNYWINTGESSYVDVRVNDEGDFGYHLNQYHIRLSGSNENNTTTLSVPPGKHVIVFKVGEGAQADFYLYEIDNSTIKPDWSQIKYLGGEE